MASQSNSQSIYICSNQMFRKMFKTFLTLYIAAIALPSLIGLIFFKTLNNLMLLTTLSINIISLLMIIYIYINVFYVYSKYIISNFSVFINKILDILNNAIHSKLSDLLVIEPLKLIDKEFDKISKFTLFNYENNKLLKYKYLFFIFFSYLILEEEFKKIGKKIIIVSISKEDKTFYIHKNIIIDENTTIDNYLEKIKNSIQAFYESGYPITTFNILQVKL